MTSTDIQDTDARSAEPIETNYNGRFFDSITETGSRSATALVPIVLSLLPVNSVVDVGCGEGAWLEVFRQHGVSRIYGLDGDYVDRQRLHIPPDDFKATDLSRRFDINGTFDLAVSLEVAEHLPPAAADDFVESLCRAAPAVLFSAAIPGQGGTTHLNEQWPAFWAELFNANGFDCFDVIRSRIWGNVQISWWYKQNCLVFARQNSDAWHTLRGLGMPGPAEARVRTELYEDKIRSMNNLQKKLANPGIKGALRMLRTAAACRLKLRSA